MNTLDKIKQLENELADLKAQFESESSGEFKREMVSDQDRGYYLTSTLKVDNIHKSFAEVASELFKSFNYFKTKEEIERVRDYRLKTALFVEAALFYSQGYEFEHFTDNFSVWYDAGDLNFTITSNDCYKVPTQIYMTKQQAVKFCDWCNKHKEELI